MTESATSGPPPLPSAVRALRSLLSWKSLPYVLIFFGPAMILAPWFGVVLDSDEGAYATVAMALRPDLVPYRALFDHKPPLVYGIYWFAFFFGQDVWQPRILAALTLGAAGVMTVLTAREMGYGRGASAGARARAPLRPSLSAPWRRFCCAWLSLPPSPPSPTSGTPTSPTTACTRNLSPWLNGRTACSSFARPQRWA